MTSCVKIHSHYIEIGEEGVLCQGEEQLRGKQKKLDLSHILHKSSFITDF